MPAATKVILGSFVKLENADVTLVRARGSLMVQSDQGLSEFQVGAMGMIIVTDEAFAVGASAIPAPVFDGGNDWSTWEPFQNQLLLSDATGVRDPAGFVRQFDSKAMRVWQEGTRIVIMIENASATTGLLAGVVMRILVRLRV